MISLLLATDQFCLAKNFKASSSVVSVDWVLVHCANCFLITDDMVKSRISLDW